MSGTRLTRKVTVEGTKKVAEPSLNPRRLSVFERLGPGAVEVNTEKSWFVVPNVLRSKYGANNTQNYT